MSAAKTENGPMLRSSLEAPDKQSVRGWVAVVGDSAPRKIRLEIGDFTVETLASTYRPDLVKHGINEGMHGFSVRVPVGKLNDTEYPVKLYDVETGTLVGERMMLWKALQITDSLSDPDADPVWRGLVESYADGTITGWAVTTANPLSRIQLEVLIFGIPVFRISTNAPRKSVAEALGFPVACGFSAKISQIPTELSRVIGEKLRAIDDQDLTCGEVFDIRIVQTGLSLPQSSEFKLSRFPREMLLADMAAARSRAVANDFVALRNKLLEPQVFGGDVASDVKILANYLPQFHPFAENNEWWGEGFTEWSNVSTATAYFDGHYQPRIPADLGYYDLRLSEVQEKQIALAKQYGISGFIYYFYWFSGKTVMSMPLERHFEKNLDLDFCLCWANENWSRRWDGSEKELLLEQRHTLEDDVAFIRGCLKYFASERYIKINGAPLLQVYRISLLEDPASTILRWKEIVREAGYPDLHVSMCETFDLSDPLAHGCDSSSQFPPHRIEARNITATCKNLAPQFSGLVYDYGDVVANEVARPVAPHIQFRAAMPSWDNTSRKGLAGNVFHGSTPELFQLWLTHLVDQARVNLPESHRFVIINAWNEWAEGAHLEPDRALGHRNLQVVREALLPSRRVLSAVSGMLHDDVVVPGEDLKRLLESLLNSNRQLARLLSDHERRSRQPGGSFVRMPRSIVTLEPLVQLWGGSTLVVDNIQGKNPGDGRTIILAEPAAGLQVSGWARIAGAKARRDVPMFASLRSLESDSESSQRFIALVLMRTERVDVSNALRLEGEEVWFGFHLRAELRNVPAGHYAFELIMANDKDASKAYLLTSSVELVVG